MGLEDLKENKPRPPMEWFTALGSKKRGILIVVFDKEFPGIAEGQVQDQYLGWCHFKNHFIKPSDPPEEVARIQKIIADAEALIMHVTGFSPRDIHDMACELKKQYKGKKDAPIKTELV